MLFEFPMLVIPLKIGAAKNGPAKAAMHFLVPGMTARSVSAKSAKFKKLLIIFIE